MTYAIRTLIAGALLLAVASIVVAIISAPK